MSEINPLETYALVEEDASVAYVDVRAVAETQFVLGFDAGRCFQVVI